MSKNFFDSPYLLLENINRFSNRKLSVADSDAQHTIRIQLYLLETHRNVGNVFDLEKVKSLEDVIDLFVTSTGNDRFLVFKENIYNSIVPKNNG